VLRDRTKTGRERTVTLDAATVAAIEAWHAEADAIVGAPTRWMLAEPGAADPPSPRWLYEVFMRAGTRAGVPVGRADRFVLQNLRHWAASTAWVRTPNSASAIPKRTTRWMPHQGCSLWWSMQRAPAEPTTQRPSGVTAGPAGVGRTGRRTLGCTNT
jgi:hypothetical protein